MTDSKPRPSGRIALLCGTIIGMAAPIALVYAPHFRMTWVNAGLLAAVAIPIAFFRGNRGSYLKGILAGILVDVIGAFLFLAVVGFPRMG
ncbi:MAG: hypothetical protein HY293_05000 [Planctomycetes bacterium]|nr:hypothetical protein [Planctomycetota bacterium]